MKFLQLNEEILSSNILGIDETGVGDYFTPLVACCAFLPQEMHQWAKELGVKDSKLLTNRKIKEIGKELKLKVPHSFYVLSQQGYNTMVTKKFNANELKFFIHTNAILNFEKKYQIANKEIVVDQYSTTKSINHYAQRFSFIDDFNNLYNKYNQIYLTQKAEQKYLSVACASILARYYLLEYMEKQNKDWNFAFPFGASKAVKEKVLEFKKNHGDLTLWKVAKTNFKI